jgi:formiminoglutamase
MENIFEFTSRPDKNLFYKRIDHQDIRLGETVTSEILEYYESNVVILGSPQDGGVPRNKGREGAKEAPDKVRESFYKLSVNKKLKSLKIFDIGNIKAEKSLEEIHENQEEVVFRLLKDNKKIVILGGGNDISYPDCKALSKFKNDPLVFNIDSHFDVRADKPRNSGTSYRMLIEEKLITPKNFYEIGIKKYASSEFHKNYLETKGCSIFYFDEVKKRGIQKLLKEILANKKNKVLFWGFDMDAVNSADAPGVSAPNPTGLSADEAVTLAEAAGKDKRTRIFEISEINPKYDIDNKTCRLAAVMIWYFLNSLNI